MTLTVEGPEEALSHVQTGHARTDRPRPHTGETTGKHCSELFLAPKSRVGERLPPTQNITFSSAVHSQKPRSTGRAH